VAFPVSSADALIRAALRGDAPPWPDAALGNEAIAVVLQRTDFHGVAPLLHRVAPPCWPAAVAQSLRRYAVAQTLWELQHQPLLEAVLSALSTAGAQPVLLKGTALSAWLYESGTRTRADTDLLVAPAAKDAAHTALLALGWRPGTCVSGEFVSYQASYTRRAPDGSLHALDLHWRLSNAELLSHVFTHAELHAQARDLPALGTAAVGTSTVHSLLFACLHRAVHRTAPYHVHGTVHREPDRLIWLMDIHRLANELAPGEWKHLLSLARTKGLVAVTREALAAAHAQLGTRIPDAVRAVLDEHQPLEPVHGYLQAGAWKQQWMDLAALPGWRARARLVGELLFPSPAYMRSKFEGSPSPLAWLYLRRAAAGAFKRLRTKAAHP
jgi:hypothetical protein